MKRYRLLLLLSLFVIAGCIVSCKKNKGDQLGDVKIARIDHSLSGSTRHYRFVYDQNNNVDSIVWVGDGASSGTSGFKKFTYFGSSFSITDEYSNTFTVYANTSGMILKVLVPDTLVMYYKNSVLEALEHKTVTTATMQYYIWKDGNVTTIKQPSDTLSFYYDAAIGGQAGDPWRVDDILAYGRPYIKTAHLPKGVISDGDTTGVFYYQYDTKGRIASLMRVSKRGSSYDTATYSYQYY